MRFYVLLFVIAGAMAGLSGCNTVEGFGQDMQQLGDNISGASRDAQQQPQPAGYQAP